MSRRISREQLRGYAILVASWALLAFVLLNGEFVEKFITPIVYALGPRHSIVNLVLPVLSTAILAALIWRWERRRMRHRGSSRAARPVGGSPEGLALRLAGWLRRHRGGRRR
jgi:hypothetical protein